ncbi:SDR family NAD(P)-dependent oxidoreductase [Dermatobacter hominis]|uniref:SDR family NAD(P)-dependent oxidoreductase n=1 Tax=Dermatobacter hominis TaxID=2884263 RepID=UPI001D12D87E|nr:SDR family oxidoreductase [Dermatobacter hominis]UDY34895.1 SDR family oxidoreductase [Dermatobacter hominis]
MDETTFSRLFDMTDRVVIVTGGTRGIGRALAEGYALAGAKVVVASRKAEACDETAEHLRSLGADAIGVPAHLGELGDLQVIVDRAVDAFGGIDVVVNNAATALAQPVGEYTPEAFEKSLNVNLRGPVFLIQAALPHLKESPNAAVLNILSGAAFMFSSFVSMYGIGKAGLLSATRSAAAELAPHGIRVNALSPGTVDTDMVRANTPEMQDVMAEVMLLKRMASPDEIVGPALMLTSDAGSFITGQVLLVDGGMVPH